MKESSETHLVIKTQPLKHHNPKTVQNGKIPPPPIPVTTPATGQSQASTLSPPSKNRGRRRNRGGRKSDQGDVSMRPSSRPRKPPPPSQTTSSAVVTASAAGEIVAVNHQMQMGVRKNSNFAPRPGFGTLGTKCIVKANHFLADLPTKDLNQYDVSLN